MNYIFSQLYRRRFFSLYKVSSFPFTNSPKKLQFRINTDSIQRNTNKANNPKIHWSLGNKQPKLIENEQDDRISDNKTLQILIRQKKTVDSLLEFYMQHHQDFDLVNVCTCLNRIVQICKMNDEFLFKSSVSKREEIQIILESLKANIDKMDNFTISNLILNLTKLELLDQELLNQLMERALKNKFSLNEQSIVYISWGLGKLKINHPKFFDLVVKIIKKSVRPLKIKSLSNIFWAMSQVGYKNEEIMKLMENYIQTRTFKFDHTDINLVFLGYSNYKIVNPIALDAISNYIKEAAPIMSFRNLANMISYYAHLGYVDNQILEKIASEIILRLKPMLIRGNGHKDPNATEKDIKSENQLGNKGIKKKKKLEEINLLDISQAVVSFSTMNKKNPELFELFESFFRQNLEKASEEVFSEVIGSYITLIEEKATPEEILNLLKIASNKLIMVNVCQKLIVKFGIRSISKVERLKDTYSTSELDKFISEYSSLLQKFIYHQDQLDETIKSFQKIGVSIQIDKNIIPKQSLNTN